MRCRALILTVLTVSLVGCERGMHDMYDQPRYDRGREAPLFDNHVGARRPPAGTVPLDEGDAAERQPLSGMRQLQRGRERYGIYCAPCHGAGGDGDGMVVRRGFPAPPTYHQDRLREADDAHFDDVITRGWGVMYPYGDRVPPADRQAIVAYIRVLQLSRRVPADQLSPDDLHELDRADAKGASP